MTKLNMLVGLKQALKGVKRSRKKDATNNLERLDPPNPKPEV